MSSTTEIEVESEINHDLSKKLNDLIAFLEFQEESELLDLNDIVEGFKLCLTHDTSTLGLIDLSKTGNLFDHKLFQFYASEIEESSFVEYLVQALDWEIQISSDDLSENCLNVYSRDLMQSLNVPFSVLLTAYRSYHEQTGHCYTEGKISTSDDDNKDEESTWSLEEHGKEECDDQMVDAIDLWKDIKYETDLDRICLAFKSEYIANNYPVPFANFLLVSLKHSLFYLVACSLYPTCEDMLNALKTPSESLEYYE